MALAAGGLLVIEVGFSRPFTLFQPVFIASENLPAFLIFAVATTVCAELDFRLVERPAARWIRRWQRRSLITAAAP